MKWMVSSGNYTTNLEKTTAGEAATEAIILWRQKKVKPNLSEITTVQANKKSFFFLTETLMESTLQFAN